MLSRRALLHARFCDGGCAGSAPRPSWLVRAAAQARQQTQDPDRDLSARRGRRLEHRRSVLREALLRSAAEIAVPPPGKANGAIDLDGRFGLHPVAAGSESRSGTADSWRSSKPPVRPIRTDRTSMRRIHGIGNARANDYRGWLVESCADTARSRRLSSSCDCDGTATAANAPGNRGGVAVSNLQQFQVGNRDTAGILESMYADNCRRAAQRHGKADISKRCE